MTLLLVRHGLTMENQKGVLMGQQHGSLSTRGIEQAKNKISKLQKYKIDAIYSSDLKRCVKTALIIARGTKLSSKLHLTKSLREINFGQLQGKPYPKNNRKYAKDPSLAFPGGESNLDVINRVIRFMNKLYEANPNSTILIISHSGPIRVIVSALDGVKYSDSFHQSVISQDEVIKKEQKSIIRLAF